MDIPWGVIGAVAGLLALPLAAFFTWYFSGRKVLTWTPLGQSTIADLSRAEETPISLVLGDEHIREASLVKIRIRSAGNRSLRPEDFDGPLRIQVHAESLLSPKILHVRFISETERLQNLTYRRAENQLAIDAPLIRCGEEAVAEIITDTASKVTTAVTADLVDGKGPLKVIPSDRRLAWIQVVLVAVLVLIGASVLLFPPETIFLWVLMPFMILLAVIGMGVGIWQSDAVRILRGLEPLPKPKGRKGI